MPIAKIFLFPFPFPSTTRSRSSFALICLLKHSGAETHFCIPLLFMVASTISITRSRKKKVSHWTWNIGYWALSHWAMWTYSKNCSRKYTIWNRKFFCFSFYWIAQEMFRNIQTWLYIWAINKIKVYLLSAIYEYLNRNRGTKVQLTIIHRNCYTSVRRKLSYSRNLAFSREFLWWNVV